MSAPVNGSAAPPVELAGHRPGHVVARGHQTVDAAADSAHSPMAHTSGAEVRQRLVDDDAAPLAELEAGRAGEVVAGADAGGEHEQVGREVVVVGEGQGGTQPSAPATISVVASPEVHLHAELLDPGGAAPAAALVDLHGHEPGGELDDVGLEPHVAAARWPPRARAVRRRYGADRRAGRRAASPWPRGRRWCGRRTCRQRRGRAREARTGTSRWRGPARRRPMVRPPSEVTGGRRCRSSRPGRRGAP